MDTKSMWLLVPSLGMAVCLAGAGCADDADAGSPPPGAVATSGSGGGGDGGSASPFAACSEGEIESDHQGAPLAGPGVDPTTGLLKAGTYMIAATYLPIKPETEPQALELAGAVAQELSISKGLVASALSSSASCLSLRTLSVWETEEDMFAFVGSPAHVQAMAAAPTLSRGGTNTTSWEANAEVATWEEGARQLAKKTGEKP